MQALGDMSAATQQRLLALNRAFYAQVAMEFDRSRAGLAVGWQQLLAHWPPAESEQPPCVLDVGCGNGRFARALEGLGRPFFYTGVDADAALLALAAQHTTELTHVRTQFVQVDLSKAGWATPLHAQDLCGDLIVCLAVLHHLPGFTLRVRLVQDLAALLAPEGLLAFSNWQFLTAPRLAQKQIDWTQVGLRSVDVEPGDALLPWRRGGFAIRYVHQIDEVEMSRLADSASLQVVRTFYADGKEGNLNLYSILQNK